MPLAVSARSRTRASRAAAVATTAQALVGEWDLAYDRRTAAFPDGVDATAKYWPPVRRIDGAYGDRHLVCSCPSPEAFED